MQYLRPVRPLQLLGPWKSKVSQGAPAHLPVLPVGRRPGAKGRRWLPRRYFKDRVGFVTVHLPSDGSHGMPNRPTWFAETVRLVIAPLVCLIIGFSTADFLLSGLYTWPRASRVLALTLTVAVLGYEFVFKEQRIRSGDGSGDRPIKALLYSCLIPYAVGFIALMSLAKLAR